MRLPKTWLQDYVDFNVTDEEFIEHIDKLVINGVV